VDGVVTTPRQGLVRPIALASGGFMTTHLGSTATDVSYLSRYNRDGVLDMSYGVSGVVELRDPQNNDPLFVNDARPLADDSVLVAGSTWVAKLDATGAQTMSTRFDPGTAGLYATAVAVDADGTVAVLGGNLLVKAVLGTGLDTAFGSGGTLTLPNVPMYPAAITFHQGSMAIAHSLGGLGVRLTIVSATGTATEVPLMFDAGTPNSGTLRKVQVASAPDGSLYVSSTMTHPALSSHDSIVAIPEDGADFGVARIRNGVVDTTFGSGGYAKASFMLVWDPFSYETVNDEPAALTVGPDGAPWVIGRSLSTPMAYVDPQYRRGPGLAIAKLLP
jgi:hypothetical protein